MRILILYKQIEPKLKHCFNRIDDCAQLKITQNQSGDDGKKQKAILSQVLS